MDITQITEGKRVTYKARIHSGIARVVQVYETKRGMRVVLHDKDRNVSVTVFPSQISTVPRAKKQQS